MTGLRTPFADVAIGYAPFDSSNLRPAPIVRNNPCPRPPFQTTRASPTRPVSSFMPPSPLRTGIVILAAGASRRMGRPKQLLPLGETTLLEHAVDAALRSDAWPVVVVLGAHAAEIRPLLAKRPVLIAENSAWSEGMASSLRAGLTVMNAFSTRVHAVLFALCDQPAFSAALVSRFIAAQKVSERSVVAARYSRHLGAPALFSRAHFPALNALVGDEGARKLIAQLPPEDVEAIDLPELAHDLDTPEDYANYRGAGS